MSIRDPLMAVLAVAIPTLLGTGVFALLFRVPLRPCRAMVWGGGFLLGTVLVPLAFHLVALVGGTFTIGTVGAALAALGAVAAGLAVLASRLQPAREPDPVARDIAIERPWLSAIAAVAATMLVIRTVSLAIEASVLPLFPWDAWSQWSTKARIWFEMGRFVPFVTPDAWLAAGRSDIYTDTNPAYPGSIPLLQSWAALWIGSWNDNLVNLAWPAAFVAMVLYLYGQARAAGVGWATALIFVYLVSSTPIVSTHVALAGYADLFMAFSFSAAALGVLNWRLRGDLRQLAAAIFFLVACPLVKRPGLVWAVVVIATVAASLLMGRFGPRRVVLAVSGASALALVLILLASGGGFSAVPVAPPQTVAAAIAEHALQLANWHLLWYAAILIGVWRWRRAIEADVAPLSVTVILTLAFLLLVFFAHETSNSIVDGTTINRALLHMVPLLGFFLMLLSIDAPEPVKPALDAGEHPPCAE